MTLGAPQLAPLQGRELRVAVRAGMAGMSGQATLDGTPLDDPMCSVSYADMSPALPQQPPRPCPVASPFSAAAGDAPAATAGGSALPQQHPACLHRRTECTWSLPSGVSCEGCGGA